MSRRSTTDDPYQREIRRHPIPALGKLPLNKLAPRHIQRLQSDMLGSGLSPRTVAYARAILRKALGEAVRWNVIAHNPATLVDAPKQQRSQATDERARRRSA